MLMGQVSNHGLMCHSTGSMGEHHVAIKYPRMVCGEETPSNSWVPQGDCSQYSKKHIFGRKIHGHHKTWKGIFMRYVQEIPSFKFNQMHIGMAEYLERSCLAAHPSSGSREVDQISYGQVQPGHHLLRSIARASIIIPVIYLGRYL